MSTFVLVHGAWQTASTWDLVVPKLRSAGHCAVMPTLTGLGQSRVRLSSAVDLHTHIEDVVRVLITENLKDVILVGHSYAGMIITGVAERTPDRLNRLVYVDAFVPEDGQCALDLMPESIRGAFQNQADTNGDGWLLACGEGHLDLWGLKQGLARDFVRSRLCDFSLRCFEQKIHIPTGAAARLPRVFIACVAADYPARIVFEGFGERARREGWEYREMATGHDCHVEAPDLFVSALVSLSANDEHTGSCTGR